MFDNLNYLALLACGVAAMVIGYLWYGMMMFGKTWMKEVGITQTDAKDGMKNMPKTYGLMFVGALVQAYVLSVFIGLAGAVDYVAAAQVAFWAWLGFVVTIRLSDVLFEKKSTSLFGINVGYTLITMIVMSAILVTL